MALPLALPFLVVLSVLCTVALQVTGAATGKTPPPVIANISKVVDSKLFTMYYGQSFKVIKNGADGLSYLLIQNSSKMAARTRYCTGRIKSFVIPLSNYSIDNISSPVSFFELLGVLDTLKGITSDQIPSSACALQSYSSGNILLVNTSSVQQLSQFGVHFLGTADGRGCNFARFAPAQEVTPLQRAEWIKYLGAYTNSESRANEVYDSIKSNYLCLSKAGADRDERSKPLVAWMEYKQGAWTFAKEAYKLQYVTDAGGNNVDATLTSYSYNVSDSEDLDTLHAILCTVDVVVDETYATEPANYLLSTLLDNISVEDSSFFSFLVNKSVWRYDKRTVQSSLDWFDGAISQPQLVLADMIEMLYPSQDYTTIYFRNLAKGEGVIQIRPDDCQRSISTPLDPTIASCQ